jgi:hypothetical protein
MEAHRALLIVEEVVDVSQVVISANGEVSPRGSAFFQQRPRECGSAALHRLAHRAEAHEGPRGASTSRRRIPRPEIHPVADELNVDVALLALVELGGELVLLEELAKRTAEHETRETTRARSYQG